MAKSISHRVKITGTLTAQTPLHVGGLGTDPTVDLSLAVNGQNQIYIPGTSLAGAFRNWMADQEIDTDVLWGFQIADQGSASFIVMEDAVVTPAGAIAELRDHVGIDRFLGAASDKTKFDRAILPKGSHFPLEMTVDLRKNDSLDAVEQLLYTLKQEGLRLGAAKTRGLGLIKVTDLYHQDYDFNSFSTTIAALKAHHKPSTHQRYEPQKQIQSSKLHLSIEWEPIGAVMVKSGQDGVAVDILPLVSRDQDQVAFVLPGSSIKGALRSQAERMLRTVLNIPISAPSRGNGQEQDQKLQDQLEHSQLELTQWLFGRAGKKEEEKKEEEKGKKEDKTPRMGRGALFVDDCYCQKQIKPEAWEKVEQAIDDPQKPNPEKSDSEKSNRKNLRECLNEAGLKDTQQAFHVAIDRWTGGAADKMLYTALEPFNLRWNPIELTLDLKRIPAELQDVIQALLLLTLRDLAMGRIPLGYGVNRGYGSLKVNKIRLQVPTLPNSEITILPNGAIAGIDLTSLNTAWQTWLNDQGVTG